MFGKAPTSYTTLYYASLITKSHSYLEYVTLWSSTEHHKLPLQIVEDTYSPLIFFSIPGHI
jgi:hypothetical protein